MLFPTVEFAIFFLIAFALSWATHRSLVARKVVLLVASYIFYGWWDWRFVFLLAQCSVVNYMLALAMESVAKERSRKIIMGVAVVFNLGVLGFFKYWGFFLSSLNDVLLAMGFARDLKIMSVLLPIGVSFFTFQGISYVTDVYRKQIKATTSILDMLLLTSFFPHLVAGPIVRASEFLPQLAAPADPARLRATRAFLLIGLGLFKKVVIAHYLAVELVNPVFESPSTYGTVDVLFAIYGYAVQIYCDFSAYSDIAIGLAFLFGFKFPKNFNQPYRSLSLQDFWRRWHMSLSSFLKDYLYIPLGGSRGGELLTYRNLFLTMVLGGLWHGAAWTFALWGVLHGGGLAVERFMKSYVGSINMSPVGKMVRLILVFHFVCLTWVFFNAESFGIALEYLSSLANVSTASKVTTPFMLLLLGVGFAGQFLPHDLMDRIESGFGRIPLPVQAAALGMAVVVISAFGPGTLAPFIYFKF